MGHILALGFHGLEAGGVGRAGGGTTTTSERRRGGNGSRSRSVALPTTGTRLPRRGAPLRRPAPPPAARRPPPHRSRAAAASIHSLHTQLFIRAARWTRTRSSPPRERATRARPPPRRCAPARGAERPPPRARPPRTHCRKATPTLPANFETLPSII